MFFKTVIIRTVSLIVDQQPSVEGGGGLKANPRLYLQCRALQLLVFKVNMKDNARFSKRYNVKMLQIMIQMNHNQ